MQNTLRELMIEPFAFLLSNLGLYMEDPYASHILRTFIEVFASVCVPDTVLKSRVKSDFKAGCHCMLLAFCHYCTLSSVTCFVISLISDYIELI